MLIWIFYQLNHIRVIMVRLMDYQINKHSIWTISIFSQIWYYCTQRNIGHKPLVIDHMGVTTLRNKLYVSSLHCMCHQCRELIKTSYLTYPSIDWLHLKLLHQIEVNTSYAYQLSYLLPRKCIYYLRKIWFHLMELYWFTIWIQKTIT